MIDEGTTLVSEALAAGHLGAYLVQAAIAALHDEAPGVDSTDWPQILGLYDLLTRFMPGPTLVINRAVAVAEVHGPEAALSELGAVSADPALRNNHRLHALQAHLHHRLGNHAEAAAGFTLAAKYATNLPERRYLDERAARAKRDLNQSEPPPNF